mgnify:CR=1 FL=1
MVSVLLQAGCDKNAKMGIPATITPLNLATELGLKDIICLLSKSSMGRKSQIAFTLFQPMKY